MAKHDIYIHIIPVSNTPPLSSIILPFHMLCSFTQLNRIFMHVRLHTTPGTLHSNRN